MPVSELVLSAFLGAAFALGSQFAIRRWRAGVTARAVAVALSEELSAVEFKQHASDDLATFHGFSDQTFGTLFRESALTLPESLFRSVVRYHWKMGFAVKVATDEQGRARTGNVWTEVAKDGMDQWHELRPRLESYGDLSRLRLFWWRGEPDHP